jgi:hypothetical protein
MPHLHAMLMPATADGRRKAHEVFNPASLHQLQTDYSLAMQAVSFAVQRGIKGVRSSTKPSKPITAPQASAEQLASLSPGQIATVAAMSLYAQQRHRVEQQAYELKGPRLKR